MFVGEEHARFWYPSPRLVKLASRAILSLDMAANNSTGFSALHRFGPVKVRWRRFQLAGGGWTRPKTGRNHNFLRAWFKGIAGTAIHRKTVYHLSLSMYTCTRIRAPRTVQGGGVREFMKCRAGMWE